MVFFVCEGCNETMKKNQVEKHAARCRECKAVTCVDCSVVFWGNSYREHEAEKYEKSLYKGKVKANPQDAWNDVVQKAVADVHTAPASIKFHLPKIGSLQNVPRNEKKFKNFVKNSMKIHNDSLINDIWLHINKHREIEDKVGTSESSTVEHKPSASGASLMPQESIIVTTLNDPTEVTKEKKAKKKKRDRENIDATTIEKFDELETDIAAPVLEKGEKKKKKRKLKAVRDDEQEVSEAPSASVKDGDNSPTGDFEQETTLTKNDNSKTKKKKDKKKKAIPGPML